MRNIRRHLYLLAVLALVVSLLSSCSLEEDENSPGSEGTKQSLVTEHRDFDDPSYANEEEGAELEPIEKSVDAFLGSWHAPSDRAAYLYGNINLRIDDDGTWIGNITEEDFSGKWEKSGAGIILRDKEKIINFELFFNKDGTLMLKDLEEPDDPIVLKRISSS